MKKRILGKNAHGDSLEVCAIGLGCMGLSQSYPPFPPKSEGIEFLRKSVEMGEDFFDTSEVYGIYSAPGFDSAAPTRNEDLVGEALEPVRDQVKIATKFGWDIRDGKCVGVDSNPKTIRKAIEGSLKRLRTDHIDLYYQHRVDPKIPIEEVAGTMKDLFAEGKILFWGMSEPGEETLRRADREFHVTAVQNEYSLWFREIETGILPAMEELGIGLVPFSPLGKGVLTGGVSKDQKFASNDIRNTIPRFNDTNLLNKNLAMADVVKKFAESHETSPARIALAWLLHQKSWIVPIPGTKKIHRLEENLGAMNLEISDQDWESLMKDLSTIKIEGDRYDEHGMKMVGL